MASDSSPYFLLSDQDGIAVARVDVVEIRHPTPAHEFAADVFALVDRDGYRKLLLDLGAVRYLSSTAFAVLLTLARRVQEAGGQLKICNLHPDVEVGANIIGLGRAKLGQGLASEAIADLEEADGFWRDFDPENRWAGEASLWLSDCYAALGRRRASEEARKRALDILSGSSDPVAARLLRLARLPAGS